MHAQLAPEPGREAHFKDHLLIVLLGLFIIATVKVVETRMGVSFSDWGLYPRNTKGLLGILTMPFLHGDFEHLFSNSFALLVLGLMILHFYPKVAWQVTLVSWLAGGILVWLFARPSFHIGASGVVYGLSAFLFLSGVIRRDRRSNGAMLVVALLFGASIWGIFPFWVGISWEGHLFGALSGCTMAVIYRNVDRIPRYIEEEEEPEEEQTGPEDQKIPGWEDDLEDWEDQMRQS